MNKLLVFSAAWCGPCQTMKPSLEELDQERLVRYDIDVEADAVQKYNIRAVPTLVLVDQDGVEIQRVSGVQTLAKLQELLNV